VLGHLQLALKSLPPAESRVAGWASLLSRCSRGKCKTGGVAIRTVSKIRAN